MSTYKEQAKELFDKKKDKMAHYIKSEKDAKELVESEYLLSILEDVSKHKKVVDLIQFFPDIHFSTFIKALEYSNLPAIYTEEQIDKEHYVMFGNYMIRVINNDDKAIILHEDDQNYKEIKERFYTVTHINRIYKSIKEISEHDFYNTLSDFEKKYLQFELSIGSMRKTYGSREIYYVGEHDWDNEESSVKTLERISAWLPIIDRFKRFTG